MLNEGLKNSQYPDQFILASVQGEDFALPDDAKVSIQKILQLFHEIKSANKDLSTLPAAYELNELAVNIATSFNIMILEVYRFGIQSNHFNNRMLSTSKLLLRFCFCMLQIKNASSLQIPLIIGISSKMKSEI